MEYPEPVSIDTISIDVNGNVKMYSNGIEIRPVDVHYEKGYEGERKNRRTVSYGTEKMNVNIYSILGDYDYLIGLDTNSVGNESFSVGMIYRIYKDSMYESRGCLELISNICRLFDIRENGNEDSAELVALYELICFFQMGNMLHDFTDKKALFIIDHNLDSINDYNSQRLSLLKNNKDSLVPPNVHLMYAKADTNNDSIFNQIIAGCDQWANQLKNPEKRKEILLNENVSTVKSQHYIDNSKYHIIDSGIEYVDDLLLGLKIHYVDEEKNLDIIIHLMFKNEEGKTRTCARFFNMKAYIMCINFHGINALGLADLLKIGELSGKKYYFRCWISDIDDASFSKKVDYAIFAEK